MIKVNLEYLITQKQSLTDIFSRVFPATTSFKIMLLIDQINKYMTAYDKSVYAMRKSMSEDCFIDPATQNTVDKDFPGAIEGSRIKPEYVAQFQSEIQKLLSQEVELDFEKLSIQDLGDKHDLSPLQLLTFKDFINV